MSLVAVYNMKGGVGKTTSAVNLAWFAAAAGHRTLLWDLDPQAASSFAFRVRPRVEGMGWKRLGDGGAFAAAIKATDYDHLDVLPADFAYRKLDRLLDRGRRPERVVASLLEAFDREYDTVFLDCPAGFSLMTEAVLAAAHVVLVPTIPTIFSLRTIAPLVEWADRTGCRAQLAAFFSMVDRRRAGHRRAAAWSARHPELFVAAQIPYASIVEQMSIRRVPLPAFAARDAATAAYAAMWAELDVRLRGRPAGTSPRKSWKRLAATIESLLLELEEVERRQEAPTAAAAEPHAEFVHAFDTEARDLQRSGCVLELRERAGSWLVTIRAGDRPDEADGTWQASAAVDGRTAMRVLSGAWSPLEVLEHRLRGRAPAVVGHVRAIVAGWTLRRIDSRVSPGPAPPPHDPRPGEAAAVNDWTA
jgi:cellulose biosynthesis protein BcsQ